MGQTDFGTPGLDGICRNGLGGATRLGQALRHWAEIKPGAPFDDLLALADSSGPSSAAVIAALAAWAERAEDADFGAATAAAAIILAQAVAPEAECQALRQQLQMRLADHPRDLLADLALAAEARLAATSWSLQRAADAVERLLVQTAADHPIKQDLLIEVSLRLATQGLLARWRPFLEADPAGFKLQRAIDAIETGRAAEAESLLAAIDGNDELIVTYRHRLELQVAHLQSLNPAGITDDHGHAALVALAGSAIGEIETAATTIAPGSLFDTVGIDSWTPVRLTLGQGMAEAARTLVQNKLAQGDRHPYLSDFFLARAAYIDGQHVPAAELMAKAFQRAAAYQALGRLRWEFHLAAELDAYDALALGARLDNEPPAGDPASGAASANIALATSISQSSAGRSSLRRFVGTGSAIDALRDGLLGNADRRRRRITRDEDLPPAPPVLLCGERGTGKDLLARVLHDFETGASKDIAVLPAATFTEPASLAAVARITTLVLDAIETGTDILLPLIDGSLLDEHGAPIRPRLICLSSDATAIPDRLGDLLRPGAWTIPPLREHLADIPDLVAHRLADRWNCLTTPESDAIALLQEQSWPGNVRELFATVDAVMTDCRLPTLTMVGLERVLGR